MNISIEPSRAGIIAENMCPTGKELFLPRGFTNHPLFSGAETLNSGGTANFCTTGREEFSRCMLINSKIKRDYFTISREYERIA